MIRLSLDFSQCGINIDPIRLAHSHSNSVWPWMGSLGCYEGEEGKVEKGGKVRKVGEVEEVEEVGKVWSHKCGATLVGETKVVTAAHCVNSNLSVLARY